MVKKKATASPTTPSVPIPDFDDLKAQINSATASINGGIPLRQLCKDIKEIFGYELMDAVSLYECRSLEDLLRHMDDAVRIVNSDRGPLVVALIQSSTVGVSKLIQQTNSKKSKRRGPPPFANSYAGASRARTVTKPVLTSKINRLQSSCPPSQELPPRLLVTRRFTGPPADTTTRSLKTPLPTTTSESRSFANSCVGAPRARNVDTPVPTSEEFPPRLVVARRFTGPAADAAMRLLKHALPTVTSESRSFANSYAGASRARNVVKPVPTSEEFPPRLLVTRRFTGPAADASMRLKKMDIVSEIKEESTKDGPPVRSTNGQPIRRSFHDYYNISIIRPADEKSFISQNTVKKPKKIFFFVAA